MYDLCYASVRIELADKQNYITYFVFTKQTVLCAAVIHDFICDYYTFTKFIVEERLVVVRKRCFTFLKNHIVACIRRVFWYEHLVFKLTTPWFFLRK